MPDGQGKPLPERETMLRLSRNFRELGVDNTWGCGKIRSPPVEASAPFPEELVTG